MQRDQKTLTCGLYTRVVDDGRIHAAIKAVEATLPTEPLIYTVSESATLVRLDDPGAWLTAQLMADETDFICNGNKRAYVKLFARAVSSHLVLEDEPITFMIVRCPDTPEFRSRTPELLRTLCPAVHAYWANASPLDARVAIVEGAGRKNPPPKSEIPLGPTTPIVMPGFFGWLNYWSNESCRLLDFAPDDPRAKLFTRVTPIEGHGVMLQLTEEPLDLDRPEHLAALTAAYDAFPDISQARSP